MSSYLRKLQPTTIILLSFFLVISIGTLLLCLPISHKQYSIGFLNNLFVATSATCVTGLTPVAISETYTFFGQVVILILIQIGGLGFITLFMFFLATFSSKLSLTSKGLLSESLSIQTNYNISSIVKNILKFTFIFEGIGALLLCIRFIPEFGLFDGIFNSIFVSISAFCNAGFDNFGSNSLIRYVDDAFINLVISSLIIIGGIGFMVWFEIGNKLKLLVKKEINLKTAFWKSNLHTKLVVTFSIFLLISGTIITLLSEWNNVHTLGNLNVFEKVIAAFFTSSTLRTAGFSNIDFSLTRSALQFIMIIFMLIGGSPGGTAGGVKTSTVAVLILACISYLQGKKYVRIWNRDIEEDVIHKTMAVLAMALLILFISIVLLLISDGSFSFMEICFEAASAFATVGLSLNVTSRLSSFGKIIIIFLMYLGRVGVLTLGITLMNRKNDVRIENEIKYPKENILIG